MDTARAGIKDRPSAATSAEFLSSPDTRVADDEPEEVFEEKEVFIAGNDCDVSLAEKVWIIYSGHDQCLPQVCAWWILPAAA